MVYYCGFLVWVFVVVLVCLFAFVLVYFVCCSVLVCCLFGCWCWLLDIWLVSVNSVGLTCLLGCVAWLCGCSLCLWFCCLLLCWCLCLDFVIL